MKVTAIWPPAPKKLCFFFSISMAVLHPDPTTMDMVFCRRHLLWQILRAEPNLQVVISSDWRLRHSLAELTQQITAGGGESLLRHFVGVTPELPGLRYEYRGREQECLAWLAHSNAMPAAWYALDDVAGNFAFGASQLILIDHRNGLTEADVGKVLLKLRTGRDG